MNVNNLLQYSIYMSYDFFYFKSVINQTHGFNMIVINYVEYQNLKLIKNLYLNSDLNLNSRGCCYPSLQ